jgi:hypothetical protein
MKVLVVGSRRGRPAFDRGVAALVRGAEIRPSRCRWPASMRQRAWAYAAEPAVAER